MAHTTLSAMLEIKFKKHLPAYLGAHCLCRWYKQAKNDLNKAERIGAKMVIQTKLDCMQDDYLDMLEDMENAQWANFYIDMYQEEIDVRQRQLDILKYQ